MTSFEKIMKNLGKGVQVAPLNPKRFSDIKSIFIETENIRKNPNPKRYTEYLENLISATFPNGYKIRLNYDWLDFPKCEKFGVRSIFLTNKNN